MIMRVRNDPANFSRLVGILCLNKFTNTSVIPVMFSVINNVCNKANVIIAIISLLFSFSS